MSRRIPGLLLLLALLFPSSAPRSLAQAAPDTGPQGFRSSPVMFIENAGQWPEAARFQVWGSGQTLWLAEDALWLTQMAGLEVAGSQVEGSEVEGLRMEEPNLQPATRGKLDSTQPAIAYHLRLSFPGANLHPMLEPFDRLDTHVSYFIGNDPAGWRPDVPVWGGVRYHDLYPGVDLVVGAGLAPALDGGPILDAGPPPDDGRPQGSPLQWWLETRDGADLSAVRLRVEGADAVTVDGNALRLSTPLGDVAVPLLRVMGLQEEGSQVEDTEVERLDAQASEVTVPFAPPQATMRSAIRTPQSDGLLYGTFLGGMDHDSGRAIAVDTAGSVYATGHTWSGDFPTTPGAFDADHNGDVDVLVVRLTATGSGLRFATFLGGRDYWDFGYGIAVDAAGSAYVTGETWSTDFPTTPGAFDTSYNGVGFDAFAVKLNADGTALAYATFLGGSGRDWGNSVAVDATGCAYLVGDTYSTDFPTTPSAFDTSYNGGDDDAFVAKLNPDGTALAYATFLGSSWSDSGYGIAVDGAGQAYVTGFTGAPDFPTTPGAFDTSYNGGGDVFVVKLDAAGADLRYASFLGGRSYDWGNDIAIDSAGQAYVTGETFSANFPASLGPGYDTSFNGGARDAFVTKLDAAGTDLLYATFLGGSADDRGYGIAADSAGQAYITGQTFSADFPTSPGPGSDTSFHGGPYDAFVTQLDATGSGLLYASFLGGDSYDWGRDIAVDGAGWTYVTGGTYSADFPAARGPGYDTTYNGSSDAFVVKLLAGLPPSPAILGTIWHDRDGDGARDAGEPGLAGVQVCAEPLGHRAIRCATSNPDGSYTIELDAAGTYLVAPSAAPEGMRLTTPGFRLPVVVRAGQRAQHVDFGYRP